MFEKILIANRGEIACRIMRTCRRLGIVTVAIYSKADEKALHVELADEAYLVGPAEASASYLKADRIIDIALKSGVEAIHPGFGFLSENASFAKKIKEAGLVFIGPPAPAIESMGSKREAKGIMRKAGVPVVPGFQGAGKDDEQLLAEAEKIGFPVLVKASAGGGGKGMRLVRGRSEFISGLESARREALASFGDDDIIVEKYIEQPRHIEVQIFADSHGNCVHLFERECSLQRRHQKIVEEAPALGMTATLREEIGGAGVRAAEAVGYENAGTVEFIADQQNNFYFMEMNTRLQVEHPVTELITGQDLVEWQLRVAGGEALPLSQNELRISGHAIEARIYAENPENNFLPSTGRINRYRMPEQNVHVRIDTGVRQGDEISSYYDPMIAKLIVWDSNRTAAIRRMKKALSDYRIAGLTTNLHFLTRLIGHEKMAQGEIDTEFIERNKDALLVEKKNASKTALALATLYVLLNRANNSLETGKASLDPYSPWHLNTGWRLNEQYQHRIVLLDWGKEVVLTVHYRPSGYYLELEEYCVDISGELLESGDILADIGGNRVTGSVVQHGHELTVVTTDGSYKLLLQDPVSMEDDESTGGNTVNANMPGKVIKVNIKEGDSVERGQALLVLEAMKMEHTLTAHVSGSVKALYCQEGDQVSEDSPLVELEIGDE